MNVLNRAAVFWEFFLEKVEVSLILSLLAPNVSVPNFLVHDAAFLVGFISIRS